MSGQDTPTSILGRRQIVFATSMLLAGLSVTSLCLVPLFIHEGFPRSLFPDVLQENFFFDLFGWVGGFWLLSFISALCAWRQMSWLGQWLGILLLCLDQVVLLGLWKLGHYSEGFYSSGMFPTVLILQIFFVGYFLGFFTMPALTLSGNRRLTGLGTLSVLLPWLLGRQAIIIGTQLLCGAF